MQQIISQPDGKLAVFSTVVSAFVLTDATPEQIIEWWAEEEGQAGSERTRTELDSILAGDPQAVYGEDAMTWDEAVAVHTATEEMEMALYA